jgi:DNA-binding NarL/FixJ family response regulator
MASGRAIIPRSAGARKEEPVGSVIPVFAVEDSVPTLRALRKLLAGFPELKLVGTATSGEEALQLIPQSGASVVLMDLELPGASGIETTRALKARSAEVEVLVLTSFEDEDHVFDAMRAGASGYVVKGAPGAKLLDAIAQVEAGGTVIEPRLARRFWAYFKGVQEPRKPSIELTPLEREILFAIAKGLSNEEVGSVVALDRRSVRTQLGHIYGKLGVRSHVEAVVAALRLGLIQL